MTPAPIARRQLLAGALAVVASLPFRAAADGQPRLAIVIDDLGDRLAEGRRSIALPGPVACAFLPKTPHARHLAEAAHGADKEVLLHLPMQAEDRSRTPGPLALYADASCEEVAQTLREALAAVPYVSGVNNHMGSLVTRHPVIMRWVMQELLATDGLFFLDSRTTPATVAAAVAREVGVPALQRDVFLDNEQRHRAVAARLREAARLAQERGQALAIGHPYPTTLDVLERELPRLAAGGVALVHPTDLLPPPAFAPRAS